MKDTLFQATLQKLYKRHNGTKIKHSLASKVVETVSTLATGWGCVSLRERPGEGECKSPKCIIKISGYQIGRDREKKKEGQEGEK